MTQERKKGQNVALCEQTSKMKEQEGRRTGFGAMSCC